MLLIRIHSSLNPWLKCTPHLVVCMIVSPSDPSKAGSTHSWNMQENQFFVQSVRSDVAGSHSRPMQLPSSCASYEPPSTRMLRVNQSVERYSFAAGYLTETEIYLFGTFSITTSFSSRLPPEVFAMSVLWPSLVFITIPLLHFPPTSAYEYDYVIIGGGVCGLRVANRLSELPGVTVAVIEAGAAVQNNPNVTNVDDFTLALGTSIDWQYESTSQTYAAGQKIAYHSGKALGGSSTINGMPHLFKAFVGLVVPDLLR